MQSTHTSEQPATLEQAQQLGLLPEEFEKIKQILGRTPNFNEVSIYSVMWSEHCSYKNSIRWLKTLPRSGGRLLVEAGQENAGLVDIGDGLACAFKIESHNHPSALEPYQGAATGVGGIHRDIFTMGARPIAALNSLRFGKLESEKTKHLLKGVVKGIGDYGNAFGVPTVAGEVYFEECYEHNPLVNAMSVGITKVGRTVSAISEGVGNPVYIVGSTTGKDGIHGAAFASKDITEDSVHDLPSVQVGDPFQEKLLLEATLELIEKTDAIVGMQDMGAAGITCSTSEMSAKGKHGMKVWLDKVPTRQQNMKPWEILLSESQERMLIVVKKGKEKEVEDIFEKWDIHCEVIGEVIEGEWLEYYMYDELVAKVHADSLVLGGGAPVYEREYTEPAYYHTLQKFDINNVVQPDHFVDVARFLMNQPNIASKRWVYEQYDSMVQIRNMVTNAPADAALVRVNGTEKALSVTVDCNGRYVYGDPYKGAQIAVAEACRNVVCSGGIPLAVTNNLNFGNPYNPEVYWQFVMAVKGMGDACRKFNTPVTGGNVSFYNQSSDGDNVYPVYPTPTIGMLGLVEDVSKRMTLNFKNEGDLIYLVGVSRNDLASSEYLTYYKKIKNSPAPYFDLDEEYNMQQVLMKLIQQQMIESAHDVADGGLFVTLAESSFWNNVGFDVRTDKNIRKDAFLFGESQSRVVVSVKPESKDTFELFLDKQKQAYFLLGEVVKEDFIVDGENFGTVTEYKTAYDNLLSDKLNA
jgi:phosphoribosylformylglycinamidine synthase subunit PurL